MCGRFYIYLNRQDPKIQEIFTKASRRQPEIQGHEGDFYPGEMVPVLFGERGRIYACYMRWGIPFQKKRLINARSETIVQKPFFQDHFRLRRCLIPATGFYEWTKQKMAYRFESQTEPTLYFAGIYTPNQEVLITTTAAKEPVKAVHHRMPVMIETSQFKDWLFDSELAENLLQNQQIHLKHEAVKAD